MSSNNNSTIQVSPYFNTLPLASAQLNNLKSLGFDTLTPVQQASLPAILEGKDVIVQAKTGSGKTAAFGLGLLEGINPRFFGVQALVLCPTRELADQVANELRRLARCIPNIKLVVLCGGKPLRAQADSLQHGAHIAVGTPGRIKDHLSRETLELKGLKTLVLDEADRMLDMGFQEEIDHIVRNIPKQRQTLLFSATYPKAIKKMCQAIQQDPLTVKVDVSHNTDVIEQHFYEVAHTEQSEQQRNDTLLALFEHYQPESTVVFCRTKAQCHEVTTFLHDNRIDVAALHGDLEQDERDETLVRFTNKSCAVLVATDVAARGLDIKSLAAVINYELPHDPEVYVHRIGRTGRAGEKGLALSLLTEAEVGRLLAIEDYQDKRFDSETTGSLTRQPGFSLQAGMTTLQLDAGKKHKLRPGDLLGALTKDAGLAGAQIGKITIFATFSYVAIEREISGQALSYFQRGKVKGRVVKAREVV